MKRDKPLFDPELLTYRKKKMVFLDSRTLFFQFLWMFGSVLLVLLLVAFRKPGWMAEKRDQYTLYFQREDQGAKLDYCQMLDLGIHTVEQFFGTKYPMKFSIYVHPSRASLDEQWREDWKMPDFKSECWMVASGVGSKLDLLSIQKWKTEACDHNPADTAAIRRLFTHELVHVFHGQNNPSPDFSDVQELDWFVEGLATYVSGQCDAERMARVQAAIKENKEPDSLEAFWKGPNRYGFSGSLVMYLDQKFGKQKLLQLMRMTTLKSVLNELGISEKELIESWKSYVLSRS